MLQYTFQVAGVTKENRQMTISQLNGTESGWLVPEPTNPYDSNAVKVIAERNEGEVFHRFDLGYVPRELAPQIAAHCAGHMLPCQIVRVVGGGLRRNGTRVPLGVTVRANFLGQESPLTTEEAPHEPPAGLADKFGMVEDVGDLNWRETQPPAISHEEDDHGVYNDPFQEWIDEHNRQEGKE